MYLPLHDRILSALGTAAIVALLGAALLFGLKVNPFRRVDPEALATIAIPLAPPPADRKPPPPKMPRAGHAPAKPAPVNLRNRATPMVAPKPIVVVPQLPLLTVAPNPSTGAAASSGAGDRPGNGEGAGGEGDGYGDGGGDTPPQQRRGSLRFSDLPQALRTPNFFRKVGVIYTVETNGRVDECRITASSGIARLDALTCSLIEERFRFDPSHDGRGRAVASRITETHVWEIQSERDD